MSLPVFDLISSAAAGGQYLGGVQHMAMPKHFIVEVRSCGAAGTAYIGDMLTAFNALAFSYMALADVRIARHEAFRMRYFNNIAVSVFPA